MRYKIWVQIEEIDDDADRFENIEQPVCIKDFDNFPEAHRFLRSIATVFTERTPDGPWDEQNDDYTYPLEDVKTWEEEMQASDSDTDGEGQANIAR